MVDFWLCFREKGDFMRFDYKLAEIREEIEILKNTFDIVRLVEPIQRLVCDIHEDTIGYNEFNCHNAWEKEKRCQNCISVKALQDKQVEIAIELLDRVIGLQPDWAEAWNQRANALYLAGDSIRSMVDIGETLKREPRHYGAMMGLGMILRQQGEDKAAMIAFRKALEIYPQFDAVKKAVDALKTEVDGRDA